MSGGWTSSDRRSRLPGDWPARKRAVRARSGGICEKIKSNGRRCANPANGGVDHVVPGDDHALTNLMDTCHWHHSKKSAAEGNQGKTDLRGKRVRPTEGHPGALR